MDVITVPQCEKEIKDFSEEIKGEILDAVAKLKEGLTLSMPLSRPMPSIGAGVHELRFKDRSGQHRVIYVVKTKDAIYLVHAFSKKTQQTPKKNIETAKRRIKQL